VPKQHLIDRFRFGFNSDQSEEATCPRIAPESPENAPAVLSDPSSTPPRGAFWQALLYGSPDALVSPSEANTAVRLVASELSTDLDVIEFTESIRGQHAA
jgi:hypothetical protein